MKRQQGLEVREILPLEFPPYEDSSEDDKKM